MKLSARTVLAACLLVMSAQVAHAAELRQTVLAGGCFWCMEGDFEKLDGVLDVVSGFTGGTAPEPTYSGDHTGHYEAVLITYDPARISYQQLIDHFWVNIDPFDARGQFCDKGPSYLSAIFVAGEEERAIAAASRAKVEARFPDKEVVTPILDAATFHPVKGAEAYHQDYAKNNPLRYRLYRSGFGRDARLQQIWGGDKQP